MSDALVTVAMPTWNTPADYLRAAVDSVLAQDMPLQLVVVSDASPTWDGLTDYDDPRLIRYALDENRGCYYAESLVLAACKTPWWTVHASDDWSDPGRFSRLLDAVGDRAAVTGPTIYHQGGRETFDPVKPRPLGHGVIGTISRHPAHLYRVDALREVGIPSDLRGSADTAVVSLFWHRHKVAVVDEAMYHVRKWGGSLTAAPQTALGTEWRRKQRKARKERFYAALAGGQLAGYAPEPEHVEALRALL